MKVSDVMQKSATKVAPTDSIKDVSRLIFSLGISGIPVVENKKLLGIITEEDIFNTIHPTLSKIAKNTSKPEEESADKQIGRLLETPVEKIMVKNVKKISSDSSVTKAQEIMFTNHFERLPVVNELNEFVGIVSQQDTFSEIIKNKVPKTEAERFAEFMTKYYDSRVDWDKRFANELPALFSQFKKFNVESAIDVGSWTGEYPIGLINKGLKKVLALDHNPSMVELSKQKLKKISTNLSKRVKTDLTNFNDLDKSVQERYDVALLMGNALGFLPIQASLIFKNLVNVLRTKKGLLIIQTSNFEKIVKRGRLLSFGTLKSKNNDEEYMFVEFLGKKGKNSSTQLHTAVFYKSAKNWTLKGITSIPFYVYTKNDLESALKTAGFSQISFFGNEGDFHDYGKLSFTDTYDPTNSDWLNIIAVKE